MRKLFFLFLLMPAINLAQDNDERIEEIRKWYKDVESNLKNCIMIPLTMFYDEDYVRGGSTEIEGYYDTINKEMIKIIERTYYDWAEDVTSYYLRKGELFFIFSQGTYPGEMYTAEELEIAEEELWERGGEAKTLNYYEERYYYVENKCIRHLSKRAEIPAEEKVNLTELQNEKQAIDLKETLGLHHHGYRIYREYMKKLDSKE